MARQFDCRVIAPAMVRAIVGDDEFEQLLENTRIHGPGMECLTPGGGQVKVSGNGIFDFTIHSYHHSGEDVISDLRKIGVEFNSLPISPTGLKRDIRMVPWNYASRILGPNAWSNWMRDVRHGSFSMGRFVFSDNGTLIYRFGTRGHIVYLIESSQPDQLDIKSDCENAGIFFDDLPVWER